LLLLCVEPGSFGSFPGRERVSLDHLDLFAFFPTFSPAAKRDMFS